VHYDSFVTTYTNNAHIPFELQQCFNNRSTPKHVGVDILKHYCNSNEACAFVGLHSLYILS